MSYTVRLLTPEEEEVVFKAFGFKNALVEFNPGKCLLPYYHTKFAQEILDAPVREDDIWLISFPRTGSTWCQEMIWLLGNDLDFETARNTIQQIRAPLIEMSSILNELDPLGKELLDNSVDLIKNTPSPRYIKSHLPHPLLPTELEKVKPKIIYTCRNPKDMCVSYYYHCKMVHGLQNTFEEFCDQLIRDLAPLGSVFSHYLYFWNNRDEENVLFLRYEDMKKDLRGTLKKIAAFLEKSYTEDEYSKLCEFLSFQNMRENKGCNMEGVLEQMHGKGFFEKFGDHFIRKGQVGDWKNHMSEEMSKRFDAWIEENTRGTGLSFD